MTCLDGRLQKLSALVSVFTKEPDLAVLNKALDAASALPRLDACSDARALGALVPMPDDPVERRSVDDLRYPFGLPRS